LLSLHNVTKKFGGLAAVKDVSFEVEKGSIVGLIGPNGSGKTTLFNVISGVYPVTGGRIVFDGCDITSMECSRVANLGLVRTFQIVRPFNELCVLDNVVAGAFQRCKSRAEAEKKAIEAMEMLDVCQYKDTLAKNLTLAAKKRLEIARILSTDPKMVMLDEVMGGLNPQETEQLVETIHQLHNLGITVLIIEHKMKCIMELSSKVIVLNNGELIAMGTPAEVVKNPEVIKAYLGADYDVESY
jgi:branched-chain amino acid transport system ATP-binding protein